VFPGIGTGAIDTKLHRLASTSNEPTSASTPLFSAEEARLYSLVSENHRQPNGPWPQMVSAVESALKAELTSTTATVLDLASGPGEPATTLAKTFPDLQIIATDVSPDMVQIASSNTALLGNIQVEQANMENLPYEDNMFDIVTCCYGYMFPEDKEKALAETYRVLKPGGSLIATVWSHMNAMYLPKLIMENVLGETPPPPPINPLSLAEPGLFQSMLTAAKFESVVSSKHEYAFDMGKDDLPFQISTLTIMAKLDELDGWKVAKEVFDKRHLEFGRFDENNCFIVGGNIYEMVVAKK